MASHSSKRLFCRHQAVEVSHTSSGCLLQGVLMQIFTRPLSDRPTVFVEIIQRIGCEREVPGSRLRRGRGLHAACVQC